MKLIFKPRFWVIFAVSIWVLLWALLASSYVFKHNYDALWLLGIFSIPSSTLTAVVSNMINSISIQLSNYRFYIELILFLLFGSIQYGVIGYIFGLGVKWLSIRVKSAT